MNLALPQGGEPGPDSPQCSLPREDDLIFIGSADPTLGVELELQILDRESGDLAPGAVRILKMCAEEKIEGVAAELMQSMEMGQKSCRLALTHSGERCEMYFAAGQCKDAKLGATEGDDAVFQAIGWTEGEFEIDFAGTCDRNTTTRSTTGLLMEAMRLMDEANANKVES